MNWIRKIWSDTGELSTRQLGFKYVLPLAAFIFTWVCIGKLYLSQLETNSQVANQGQVINYFIRPERVTRDFSRFSHIEYPLKISLKNYTFDFRLRESFTDDFIKIITQIPKGDTITIYTISGLQSILCFSSETDAYQIIRYGKIIFPLDRMKNYNLSKALLPGLMLFILWILYFYYQKGRIN
jgi:hypothetical protein